MYDYLLLIISQTKLVWEKGLLNQLSLGTGGLGAERSMNSNSASWHHTKNQVFKMRT